LQIKLDELSSPRVPDPLLLLQVIYEGYLEKKGGYTSKWGRRKAALCGERWQSRFVLIRWRTLYYFASKVRGSLFLPPSKEASGLEARAKKGALPNHLRTLVRKKLPLPMQPLNQ